VLHLTPDHLGAVTVTLQVQGTDVRLDLAANQAALETLNAGLGELREELGAAGLDLTDVTLRPDDGGQQEGRAPGQDGPADGRQEGRPAPDGDGRATDRGPDRRTGGPGQAAGIEPENRPGRSDETGPDGTRRGQPLDIRV
jgi:flagellar hook-length control protein FliK